MSSDMTFEQIEAETISVLGEDTPEGRKLAALKQRDEDRYKDEVSRLWIQYRTGTRIRRALGKTYGSGQTKKAGSHGEGRHK